MKGSEKSSSQQSAVSIQKQDKRERAAKYFSEELKNIRERNLFRSITCIESSPGPKISIKGQSFINFSSNDYLGLSRHTAISRAAISALKKYGFGSGASRLLSGTCIPHVELEKRIARFKKTEAALVFNTGYAANTGIIPAVSGTNTVIFSDELNHASIVDGTRLSKAEVVIYRHADAGHLESLLRKYSKKKSVKQCIIISETVFSMDGDIAPLCELTELSKTYHALLMLDDAHATGVLGKNGRGGLEHFSIVNDNIIQMGTLSKAAGCYGAFATGSKNLVSLLINRARSFIYSTSLPPAVAAAGIASIDILDNRSVRMRQRLWRNRDHFIRGLRDLGYDTMNSETPIIPILAGDVKSAMKLGRHLERNNIFAPAIRPPTVPEGKCRIRFSITAGHTREDIDMALYSLEKYR